MDLQEQDILSELADSLMVAEAQDDDRRAKLKAKFGKRVGGTPDEEVVSIKDEKPPVFDAPPKETKKLKPRKARKGEGLGVGARKRQGAGKPQSAAPERGGQVRFQ